MSLDFMNGLNKKPRLKTAILGLFSFLLFFLIREIVPVLILSLGLYNNKYDLYYTLVVEIFTIVPIVWINYRFFKNEFNIFKKDLRKNILTSFKGWALLYLGAFVAAILVIVFGGNEVSQNQLAIIDYAAQNKYVVFVLVGLCAPLLEELVFRKSLRDFVPNKYLFIIASGFIFGFLHVISYGDYINSIPYVMMGLILSYIYVKTDNLFIPITVHTLQNVTSFILITQFL